MVGATSRPYVGPLEMLWGAGTCAGMSDGELLARFLGGRDQAGELAFEGLVRRHGAMVERVCRQVLDDPGDVHDAWQATFVVLARRADAIRNRESVGGWLHGVALRVARRTRMIVIRHRVRDRRTNNAAETRAVEAEAEAGRARSVCGVEREERAEAVHDEISRLPEKYRAPIVLCYMEGLTHDQAAASLSWPVGTVRSRLSRGRDRLRRRLGRRGMAAPGVAGPLGAWLAADAAAGTAAGAVATAGEGAAIPASVVKAVVALASRAAAGLASDATEMRANSALALAEGVLKMMTIKKLGVMAVVVLSLATLTVGGGVAVVRTSRAASEQTKPYAVEEKKALRAKESVASVKTEANDQQAQEMVDIALRRFEILVRLHRGGEVDFDRVVDASDQLEKVELRVAKDLAARVAARVRSIKRLVEIERFEDRRFQDGRAPSTNLEAVKLRRMQAEFDLKATPEEEIDPSAILKRLKELEKKVQELEKRVPRSLGGRM